MRLAGRLVHALLSAVDGSRLLRRAVALLPDFETTVRVGPARFISRTGDRTAALWLHKLGLMGRDEEFLLMGLVRPGGVAVDVGANIGLYSAMLSRIVGPEGRVLSFEPDPDNFALLERNLALNGCANVSARRAAVSDRAGRARFFFCEEHRGDHRLYDPGDGRPSFEVETVRLDDVLPPGSRVDAIKVDVQGHEPAVFRGMSRVLADNPKVLVLCELAPALLRQAGEDARAFLHSLAAQGFRVDPDEALRRAGSGYTDLVLWRP